MSLQSPVSIRIRVRGPTEFFAAIGDSSLHPEPTWMAVSSHAPVKSLVLYCSQPIQLQPLYDLGPTFVRYWHNLPEELRVSIITQNMIAHPARQNWRTSIDLHTKLFPHCRMTPQIARLATEAFYMNNEWLIQLNSGIRNRYPPAPLNGFIRRLYLRMYINHSHWMFLRKLSDGKLGFGGLKRLNVEIDWHFPAREVDVTEWELFIEETEENPIEFSCKGSVKFNKRPPSLAMSGVKNVSAQDNQIVVRNRITFGVEAAKS